MKFIALSIIMLCSIACSSKKQIYQINGEAYGTSYRIKIIGDSKAGKNDIDAVFHQLDHELSTWNPDSWISQFNSAEKGTTMQMPQSLQQLVILSQNLDQQTEGKFDPTCGALIKLWGFGAWKTKKFRAPPEAEIAEAKAACGFNQLKIEGNQITKLHDQVLLDFSAIAKGYAVDKVAALLRRSGHENFIIEFGGDIYASGLDENDEPWKIKNADTGESFTLSNQAVATSGSIHHYHGNHSHIINPLTGYPAPKGDSVSVTADSCAEADAMATARYIEATAHFIGTTAGFINQTSK